MPPVSGLDPHNEKNVPLLVAAMLMNDVVTGQLVQIGRWHAEQVARLALALDARRGSTASTTSPSRSRAARQVA